MHSLAEQEFLVACKAKLPHFRCVHRVHILFARCDFLVIERLRGAKLASNAADANEVATIHKLYKARSVFFGRYAEALAAVAPRVPTLQHGEDVLIAYVASDAADDRQQQPVGAELLQGLG